MLMILIPIVGLIFNVFALFLIIPLGFFTGAASNHRIDKQAKSLGEYLRAKYIEVPDVLAAGIG